MRGPRTALPSARRAPISATVAIALALATSAPAALAQPKPDPSAQPSDADANPPADADAPPASAPPRPDPAELPLPPAPRPAAGSLADSAAPPAPPAPPDPPAPPGDDAATALADDPAPAPAPSPSARRSVAWLAVGATLAFATTGAILAQSTDSREDDLSYLLGFRDPVTGAPPRFSGETEVRYRELLREGETLRFYSWVSFGLAGVTALSAAGILLFDSPATRETALTPSVSRDGVRVTMGWEF